MIFAEDLNLKATSRGMLAKHCLDAGWVPGNTQVGVFQTGSLFRKS
jgi:hypothetical protein